MKRMNFSKFMLMLALPLMTAGFVACSDDDDDNDKYEITLKEEGGTAGTDITVNFPAAGDEKTITLDATHEWIIKNESEVPSWLTITPKTGKKGSHSVTVKATEDTDGTHADFTVQFALKSYTGIVAKLTVKQATAPVSNAIYVEDLGETVEQIGNPAHWPYVDEYDGWNPKSSITGMDQDQVTYSGSGANVRYLASYDSYGPHLFMNSSNAVTRDFVINNIDITGYTQLTFTTESIAYDGSTNVAKTADNIKMYAGYDGENWAPLTLTFDATTSWSPITTQFGVAANSTTLYIKIETLNANQNRFDNFTLVSGGTGAVIEPGTTPEPEETTIKALNDRITPTATAAGNYFVKGIVVTDMSKGNYTAKGLSIMTEGATTAGNGILLYGVAFVDGNNDPLFAIGDEIEIDLTSAQIQAYRGTAAQADDPYCNEIIISNISAVEATGRNAVLTPVTITYDQIEDFQGMYVQIEEVQSLLDDITVWGAEATSFTHRDDLTTEFNVYLAKVDAANNHPGSEIIGETFLTGNGTIKGIAYVYGGNNNDARSAAQLVPREKADVEGLTNARVVGETKTFTVSPNTDQTVGASAGTFEFEVTANVAWTVTSSDDTNFAVLPASGTESGTVTMTYTANTSLTDTRPAVITFTTTDPGITAPANEIVINITQEAAKPKGEVLYKETWGTFGTDAGVFIATYDKSGTTTKVAADAAGITYTSVPDVAGSTLYGKIYNTTAQNPGASGYVAPSSGYDEVSGGSQFMIPHVNRKEVLKIEGIKIYDATAVEFSMAQRRGASASTITDIVINYTFSTGEKGTFIGDSAQTETGDNGWRNYFYNSVTVPAGATTVTLEITAATGITANMRADDFILRAAN